MASDWIDVRDRSPDTKEPVVYARRACNGRWAVGIAYWTVSRRWCPELNSVMPPGFTHWKPLGDPPGWKPTNDVAPASDELLDLMRQTVNAREYLDYEDGRVLIVRLDAAEADRDQARARVDELERMLNAVEAKLLVADPTWKAP